MECVNPSAVFACLCRVMPEHELHLDIAWLALEKAAILAFPPLFPELSALGRKRGRMRERLARNAAKVLGDTPASQIYRRQLGDMPETGEVAVTLEPPGRKDGSRVLSAWREAVPLRFHYLTWKHGNEAEVAYVPALDIEVVCGRGQELGELLEHEILFALRRRSLSTSLEHVCQLHRYSAVRVERLPFGVTITTPKQLAQAEEEQTKRVLPEVATNMRRMATSPIFEVESYIETLADCLVGNARRSALLVGPSGVGKTAIVHELVRRRADFGLWSTTFWMTSGARLVAGMAGFSMWQDRCRAMCREAEKTRAVVHLGNLTELLHVGKCSAGDQGVADFLRPFIDRGDLLAIAECTSEQRAIIERDMPGLLRAFSIIEVKPPAVDVGRKILDEMAQVWSRPRRLTVTENALNAIDRLHRRYATYSVYPGRPLRFLGNLLESVPRASTVDDATVTDVFSRVTGLPRVLLDERETLDLGRTRRWLGQRVMGQEGAVDVIVDLLAGVKASLNRPDRPIASLLFLGPTGVGKTEMAKSLAEFLFQDRQRMIRIDMSEYADYVSVERLIGGVAGSEGVLTARVREQPFGIVLLDEFEKAHPRFFDLLLQVLGEGRLTDASGRLADFRNSVIVMTSNLGSESFGREQVGFGGRDRSSDGAEAHFLREVQNFVRPEFFNRIDRIVPFLPLSEEALEKIARRELGLLQRREGIQHRDLDLTFTDSLVGEVVRLGYDPRYGARPIKRAIDRHLLAPLAEVVNDYASEVPLQATIDSRDRKIDVVVKALTEREGGEPTEVRQKVASFARSVCDARREAFQLRESRVIVDLRNRLHGRESVEARRRKKELRCIAKGRPVPPVDAELLAEIEALKAQIGLTDDLANGAAELEECILTEFYAGQWGALTELEEDLTGLRSRIEEMYLELFSRSDPAPDRITLVVYSKSDRQLFYLARSYYELAEARGFGIDLFTLAARTDPVPTDDGWFPLGDRRSEVRRLVEQANGTNLMWRKESWPAKYLKDGDAQPIGIGFEISGPLVKLLLQPENGLHVFGSGSDKARCLVDTATELIADYRPPRKVDTAAGIRAQTVRRIYRGDAGYVEDKRLARRQFWKGKQLAEAMEPLIAEYLILRAKEWVREN